MIAFMKAVVEIWTAIKNAMKRVKIFRLQAKVAAKHETAERIENAQTDEERKQLLDRLSDSDL
jgi:hypothetical protein